MKYFYLFLSLFTCLSLQAQIAGKVFIDANSNGKYDLSETVVPGVNISDGYTVVRTDDQGNYKLIQHAQARFVFITTPYGFIAEQGHYLKLETTNVLHYDFPLVIDAEQEKDRINFIQVTDTETPLFGSWVDNVRNFSRDTRASFIMHTGDICYEDGMKFHAKQVNSKLMGRPIYYAVGNHDLVKGEYGEQMFESLFGPTYFSFEAGPAYFVVTPMWSGDYKPEYTIDQVIAWLKQDLAFKDKSKPLIFINHDFNVGSDYVLRGAKDSIDLKQFNLKAWLFGHWHNNFVWSDVKNAVKVVSSNAPNKGGIDHAAEQFLHIELTLEGINAIEPRYTNLRSHIKIIEPIPDAYGVKLLANVYDSDRVVSEVKASILDKNRNLQTSVDLRSVSDWAWEGRLQKLKQKDFYIELLVNYTNGTYDIRREHFSGQEQKELPVAEILWTSNLGGNVWKAGPLLHNGVVYAATIDDGGNGKAAVKAMDAFTGRNLWSFKVKNSIKQKMRIASDLLLATDVQGTVYALNAKTGALVWEKDLNVNHALPNFMSAGVLRDDVYYTGFGTYLSALEVASGRTLWQNKDWNGGEAMPGELYATSRHLITGANWNSLFVHDRPTGKLLWNKSEQGLRFRSGGVASDNQQLFVAGLNTLFVLNETTGQEIRKRIFSEDFKSMGSPTISEDLLVIPTSKNGIIALDKQSLKTRWNFTTRESLIYTSSYTSPDQHELVATVESTVSPYNREFIFGASDGFFYVLDREGKLMLERELGAPILADSCISGEVIFLADFAGNVFCIRIHKK